jgi:hypothetical protein
MATINLGNIKFNWQGAYNGATAYAVDDVVSYNGSSYICKLASTGNVPTNTTYFDQMYRAGTDGTDLTSTLTTQGDIVYRDGSGLQRLGAGTSGQVLQTGGAGANPSWGTVSSDYVKILSATASGSSDILDIDNIFDDNTYAWHKIFIRGSIGAGGNYAQVKARLLDSSGTVANSSAYRTGYLSQYIQPGPTSSFNHLANWDNSEIAFHNDLWNQYNDNNLRNFIELDIYDATDSNLKTHMYWRLSNDDGSGGQTYNNIGSGYYNVDQGHRGIRFFTNNGTNWHTNTTAIVYGIKS